MKGPITVAEEIYNLALHVIAEAELEPALLPLVMAHVSHRVESFAISEMAMALESANGRIAELENTDKEEVDNG